jgi:hypothetical protein
MYKRYLKYYNEVSIGEGCAMVVPIFLRDREEAGRV